MMVSRLNNCIKRIQQLGWTIWKQLLTGTVSLMLLTRWRYCLSVTESKKLGLRGNELVHKRTANVTNNQNNTLNLCITCETCHPRSYLNLEYIVNMETMEFLTDLLLLYMFYTHCLEQQHTHICTALCPGTTGWAGTRKVKPIWILLKQVASKLWQSVQQTTAASAGPYASLHLAPDNYTSTAPLSFLQAGRSSCHPTESKHWKPRTAQHRQLSVNVTNDSPCN